MKGTTGKNKGNGGERETELRLRLSVNSSDVAWNAVRETLSGAGDNPRQDVKLRKFIRSLHSPVNMHWLGERILAPDELEIVRSLCEYYSVDFLTITVDRKFKLPLLDPEYQAQIVFEPFFKDDSAQRRIGRAKGSYRISLFSRTFDLSTVPRALAFYLLLAVAGTMSYVLLMGFLLYSFSVVLLFVADPGLATAAAINRPSIGLALVCFLTALAGLSGKAVRNVARLLHKRLVRKERT